MNKLTVLRGLFKNPLFAAFDRASSGENPEDFYYQLYEAGAESDFLCELCRLILVDENAFSRVCAKGETPSAYLLDAYIGDLNEIFSASRTFECDEHFNLGTGFPPFDGELDGGQCAENLMQFYAVHGYGKFINHKAFYFENGELVPIAANATSPILLHKLKDYQSEKKQIGDNILNFISGMPYANMLLYGDRGTGKSSTIHAMLNQYFGDGLRLIEVDRQNLSAIPAIRRLVADNPLKFIVFIDDLSLAENDEKTSSLKAALEGSVFGGTDNVMVVATSNRRHIVKESFADRENSVHPSDSIDEQLSLSDRFGLTVMFSTTDKAAYLSIVSQLADDRELKCDRQQLAVLAERWALVKGGRSPRRAKQFTDYVFACEQRGVPVDF